MFDLASSRLDAFACAGATVLDAGGKAGCRRMADSPLSAHWDGNPATANVTPHRPAGCREARAALAAMPGSRHVQATTCRLVAAQRNLRSAMQPRRRTIPFGLPHAQGGTIGPHAAFRNGDVRAAASIGTTCVRDRTNSASAAWPAAPPLAHARCGDSKTQMQDRARMQADASVPLLSVTTFVS